MDIRDILLAICQIGFSYALIPQVISGFRQKKATMILQTSIITAIGLFISSGVIFSLGLWLSGTLSLVSGTLWVLLLVQTIIYGRDDNVRNKRCRSIQNYL